MNREMAKSPLMKPYRHWSIRNKLILPLFAAMILGGVGVNIAFLVMQSDILGDALPAERALEGIHGTSLELLGEYREFMIVPSESTQAEIDELKQEIKELEAGFEQLARSDSADEAFLGDIETSTRYFERVGDAAIATRLRLLDQIGVMEAFAAELDDLSANGPFGANAPKRTVELKSGGAFELKELVAEYLSELREYALVPSDHSRLRIAEIEQALERISQTSASEPVSKLDLQAGDAAARSLIQRALEIGQATTALTGEFLNKIEELEDHENNVLAVLNEVGLVIAQKTDKALEFGFATVGVIIVAIFSLILLVSFIVSQWIAKSVSILAHTANELGDGDFSVRAYMGNKDEIGELGATFNKMATGLELNIEHREKVEIALYTANKELATSRDRAEIANRAKSEFLAAMSHELRTPLNAVIGFSELIENETFGPIGSSKYREFSIDIRESGEHLLGLINDILDLTKIESGKDKLHDDEIDVSGIIDASMTLVGERAEKRGIKLELDIPDPLPALRADERKLKQILVNLLSNAIKFTDGGGEVVLRAWCQMNNGHVFQIVDTGVGIAPEDIPKALSRFGQVDGDLDRKYEGTGLGVPLTKALVEQHGGTFDLQSEVGVGTTVTVRFPMERIVASPDMAGSLGTESRAAG